MTSESRCDDLLYDFDDDLVQQSARGSGLAMVLIKTRVSSSDAANIQAHIYTICFLQRKYMIEVHFVPSFR